MERIWTPEELVGVEFKIATCKRSNGTSI